NEDAARREAEERVRRAQAQVDDLRRGRRSTEIEASRAQLSQAQAVAANSERDFARQADLAAKGFVSQERVDEARAARDRDRARAGGVAASVTSGAAQAEFTPPVIYSKESRAKLVFLVEAKPAEADAPKLHPGQPVDVTLQ